MANFQKIAEDNFQQWNEAVQFRDPKKVAALYSDDATFLPTVSGELRRGKLEAEEYFVHFLEKNPLSKIKNGVVQALGDDIYLYSGMYNFELGSAEKREVVEARFSFVVRIKENDKFEILHHHSSVKP